MIKKRRWLWVFLFISAALILSALATGWNLVLVKDYQQFEKLPQTQWVLVLKMGLGTSGFVAVLALTISLFIKLLSEMRLNQMQSEFLAAVSHELKTPIATLELSSSLLDAGGLSDHEKEKLWASHHTELKRLKEEVNALLEAARLQVRLRASQKSVMILETWLTQKMPHWKAILGPDAKLLREGAPLEFETCLDTKALDLLFDNLMSNARKYARLVPRVVVRTQISASQWRIQVQDDGWGFDPADSKKIFQRFFRAKTLAPYAIAGTGLGLYLAFSASRALKLKLRAESKGFEKGAIFTVEGFIVPLKKVG